MINVLLYTSQPVLVLGLASAFKDSDCHLAGVPSSIPLLLELLAHQRFDVLLIEMTPEITDARISEITSADRGAPIVIWGDAVSTEFVSKAVALGVRGVLSNKLSLELQVRCLEKVVAGELWIEKALVEKLLLAKRILFTPRELQLVKLLAQGLKNKEIAHRLFLCEGTVKVYLSRLFEKAGVTDRFEMALYAIQHLFGGDFTPGEYEAPEVDAALLTGGIVPVPVQDAAMARHRLGGL
jgi:two-component system nitrate/nitrite response regulator NarL